MSEASQDSFAQPEGRTDFACHQKGRSFPILLCRLQAMAGNLLATAIPRARIVPAVRGEDMSSDAATVCLLAQAES